MPILSCLIENCDAEHAARGWCAKHYQRWYATGTIADPIEHAACAQCGAATQQRKGSSGPHPKYCSNNCSASASYARRKDSINARKRAESAAKPKTVITCEQCSESCEVKKSTTRFCSNRCATKFRRSNHDGSCSTQECHRTQEARGLCIVCWRRKARAEGREANSPWNERRKANYQQRRALKLQLPADNIRPVDVYERDEWTCGLCSAPVDRGAVWPDPLSPSLDHILPLSKGGHHILANVQLAHLACNVRKGANTEVDAMSA